MLGSKSESGAIWGNNVIYMGSQGNSKMLRGIPAISINKSWIVEGCLSFPLGSFGKREIE